MRRAESRTGGKGSGREWRTRGGEAASRSEFERTTPPRRSSIPRGPGPAAGRSLRPSVPAHDLVQRGAEVLARVLQTGMDGERPAKELRRLLVLLERHVTE